MVKYIIVYKKENDEIDKYSDNIISKKKFNTLIAAQEELDKLSNYIYPNEIINKLPRKIIAILYKVKTNNESEEEWTKIKLLKINKIDKEKTLL